MQRRRLHRAAAAWTEVERQFQVALSVFVQDHHRDLTALQLRGIGRGVYARGLDLAGQVGLNQRGAAECARKL